MSQSNIVTRFYLCLTMEQNLEKFHNKIYENYDKIHLAETLLNFTR